MIENDMLSEFCIPESFLVLNEAQRTVSVEVAFGMPAKDCLYHGICKIGHFYRTVGFQVLQGYHATWQSQQAFWQRVLYRTTANKNPYLGKPRTRYTLIQYQNRYIQSKGGRGMVRSGLFLGHALQHIPYTHALFLKPKL
jgi:hypothetical protein